MGAMFGCVIGFANDHALEIQGLQTKGIGFRVGLSLLGVQSSTDGLTSRHGIETNVHKEI